MPREHCNASIFAGPDKPKTIYLHLTNGHYDVIRSMKGFLNCSNYCDTCQKGYNSASRDHVCSIACTLCHVIRCKTGEIDSWEYCNDCNRYFKDLVCLRNHKSIQSGKKSVCKSYYKCRFCDAFVSLSVTAKYGPHDCSKKFCQVCKESVSYDHKCYIKVVKDKKHWVESENDMSTDDTTKGSTISRKKKKKKKPPKILKYGVFDFECTQDSGKHVPNLCVAEMVCEVCAGKPSDYTCEICVGQRVFSGKTTQDDFCKWLFSSRETESSIAIAHNAKSYDSYFLLAYLFKNACIPKVTYTGAKVMCINVPQFNRKVIDSLNFLPMALSKLPSTFGLTENKKGFFPHLFNTEANQNYVGPLPSVEFYDPEGMNVELHVKLCPLERRNLIWCYS